MDMGVLIEFENMKFFSLLGLAAALIVVIPNFAFAKRGRETRLDDVDTAGVLASFLEVVSRLCLTLALIFIQMPLGSYVLGICAGVWLLIYFVLWIRYFKEGCYYPDIYIRPFLGIPVPFDVFICLYFITVSLWLSNVVALGASVIYAASRMLNAVAAMKDLRSRPFA